MEDDMARQATGARTYIVRLDAEERSTLEGIVRRGRDAAGRLLKARILLKADASEAGERWHDSRIAEALGTSLTTIWRVRQAYVEQGLEAAITRKKRRSPSTAAIFDGEAEARLIQLACSEPPPGHARWSLRLLEKHVVALGIVEAASDNTIGRVLKKTSSNPTLKNNGLFLRAATAPL
jgi:Homeodomain-like domain